MYGPQLGELAFKSWSERVKWLLISIKTTHVQNSMLYEHFLNAILCGIFLIMELDQSNICMEMPLV